MAPRLSKSSPPPPQTPQEAVVFLVKKLEPCVHRLSEALTHSLKGGADLFAVLGRELDRVASLTIEWTKCFDVTRFLYGTTPLYTSLSIGFVLYLISLLYGSFVFFYLPSVGLALNSTTSLMFHTLIFFVLMNYMRACKTDPGGVPNTAAWRTDGKPPTQLTETKSNGKARWCEKAGSYKPDRAHNCKMLGKCVLRMDHHCPWISNTVGFRNHKYFFLFLMYVNGACGMLGISLAQLLMTVALSPLTHLAVIGAEGLTLLLSSCLTPYFLFHCYLIANNMTTIEYAQKMTKQQNDEEDGHKQNHSENPYDLGLYRNICAVLGDNPAFWLLPFNGASGDGLSFSTNASKTDSEFANRENETLNGGTSSKGPVFVVKTTKAQSLLKSEEPVDSTAGSAEEQLVGSTEEDDAEEEEEETEMEELAADDTESAEITTGDIESGGKAVETTTPDVDEHTVEDTWSLKAASAWNLGSNLLSETISHFTSICVGDAKTKRASLRRASIESSRASLRRASIDSSIIDVQPEEEAQPEQVGLETLKGLPKWLDMDGVETSDGTDWDGTDWDRASTSTRMTWSSIVD